MKKALRFTMLGVLCIGLLTGCGRKEALPEVTVHEHAFDVAEKQAPSCREEGFTRFACACGEEYNEAVPALDHTPGDWQVTREATEEEEGLRQQTCEACGDLLAAEPMARLEAEEETTPTENQEEEKIDLPPVQEHHHSYKKKVVREPGCVTTGKLWYSCACGTGYSEYVPATGHDPEETTIPGSCTANELLQQRCRDCDRVLSVTISSPAPGHSFGKLNNGWTTAKKPTCEEAGLEQRICKTCQEAEQRELEPLGHDFKITEEKDPTCEEEGRVVKTCKVCETQVTTTAPALGHSWQAQKTVMPTCEKPGYTLYICTHDHGHTRNGDEVPATGHVGGQWTLTQDPTCTQEGREEECCQVCGKTLNTRSVAKKDHVYQIADTVPAACTEKGSVTYRCQSCQEGYTEDLAPMGHDYQLAEQKDSTCVEAGLIRRTCARCEDTQEESLPLAEHTYTLETHTNPTCQKEGFDRYTCAVCANSYDETISVVDHNYQPTGHRDATCTEEGYDDYACTFCDASQQNTIPVLDHQYTVTDHRDASCAEEGFDRYTCGLCENSYSDSIPALGHGYTLAGDNGHVKTYTCTRCGDTNSEIYGENHHFAETDKQNPSCTGEGYVQYVCDDCGEEYRETLAPLSHQVSTKVEQEATCQAEGLRISVCDRCGQELSSEPIAKLPHAMETQITREATCTGEGEQVSRCILCDGEETVTPIPALPHTEESTTVPTTCTQAGMTTVRCIGCGQILQEEPIAKLPHTEEKETVHPTCTNSGMATTRCTVCGETLSQVALDSLGHSHEKIRTQVPTCIEDGADFFQCTRCEDGYSQPISKLGHDYAVTETVNATGSENGKIIRTCPRCQDTQTETTPKLHHTYRQTIHNGTCKEEEKTVYTCEACGDSYEEVTGDFGDHLFEQTSYKAPTCTEDGESVNICYYCKETVRETFQATGHDMVLKYRGGDCVKDTYATYRCTKCGEEEKVLVPASGHVTWPWHYVKYPTEAEPGLRQKTCISCGEVVEEEILEPVGGLDQEFVIDLGNGETTTVIGHIDYEASERLFDMLNAYRQGKGLHPLKRKEGLDAAVAIRAPELAVNYSHTRPNGDSCFSVPGGMASENICPGSPTHAMNAWKNSEGHNEAMLHPMFNYAGVGTFAVRQEHESGGYYYSLYSIQIFGC